MVQKAIVIARWEDGRAEIEVQRESACGGECSQCHGCSAPDERIRAIAVDEIGVKPGDLVDVEMMTRKVLGAAAIVYLLPLLLFFGSMVLASRCALFSSHLALSGGIGLIAGLTIVIRYNKWVTKHQSLRFRIVNKS